MTAKNEETFFISTHGTMRAKFAVKNSWKIEKNSASFMDIPDRAYSMYAVCNSYIM